MYISGGNYSMEGAYARAFNDGSDARFWGIAYDDPPLDVLEEAARDYNIPIRYLVARWEEGWLHLNRTWALDTIPPLKHTDRKRCWIVRRIPDLDDGVELECVR